MERVALIEAGLIGQGWAIVFARAGCSVALRDPDAGALERACDGIAMRLRDLERFGLVDDPDAILDRVMIGAALKLVDADIASTDIAVRDGIGLSRSPWDGTVIERIGAEQRARLPKQRLGTRSAWRDRRLMGLIAHKRQASREMGA